MTLLSKFSFYYSFNKYSKSQTDGESLKLELRLYCGNRSTGFKFFVVWEYVLYNNKNGLVQSNDSSLNLHLGLYDGEIGALIVIVLIEVDHRDVGKFLIVEVYQSSRI